jgi:peptidoglycan-associated lipoprotein
MRFKPVALFAALALVAACESTSEETGTASGAGTGAGDVETAVVVTEIEVEEVSLSPVEAEEEMVGIGDRVFFGFDQYTLSGEGRITLEGQAALLNKYPAITVVIEGHADERGTREYNLALGERRANAAKNYLVVLGVDPGRIRTVTYGEERPAVVGSNDGAWAQNRRAATIVAGSSAGS